MCRRFGNPESPSGSGVCAGAGFLARSQILPALKNVFTPSINSRPPPSASDRSRTPSAPVKSDANACSGRMQTGGQTHALRYEYVVVELTVFASE